MKITKVELKNFCAFKQAGLEFCSGINVFIGANATGKSHLMKVLYSILRANEKAQKLPKNNPHNMLTVLSQKLMGVFRPDPSMPPELAKTETEGLGRLVTRGLGSAYGGVCMETDAGKIFFELTTAGNFLLHEDDLSRSDPAVFLPTREVLSMYEGFISAYETKLLSFDETYYDLCVALGAALARGPLPQDFGGLSADLEHEIGGKVRLFNNRFYVSNMDGVIEAHMLAEGMRKLGSLFQILQNQSLSANGFLFWDEPEANLNPKLVNLVVKILCRLAAAGVQVFVSTHDYLLSTKLSLAAEYKSSQSPDLQCDLKFFCLSRETGEGVSVESAPILPLLEHNPILEEFAEHYNQETKLFSQD